MATKCQYCDSKATHLINDIDMNAVSACAECCGGCIGDSLCDYDG